MEIKDITVFISTHPSGGFTLDIPENIPEKAMDVLENCAIWKNGCSREEYVQFEYSRKPFQKDFDFFKLWVEMTFGLTVPLLNLEIKIQ